VFAELRLAPNIPAVMVDRVQLQQVLLNLIVNACDAMAQREPRERLLQIVSTLGADGAVRIEICDSGQGVEDPEAIFAPFFSTKNGGIGLGLAICRTIIASHRGRLWASNNATYGATLHIWMPPTTGNQDADDARLDDTATQRLPPGTRSTAANASWLMRATRRNKLDHGPIERPIFPSESARFEILCLALVIQLLTPSTSGLRANDRD
jgi:hypothetical protein